MRQVRVTLFAIAVMASAVAGGAEEPRESWLVATTVPAGTILEAQFDGNEMGLFAKRAELRHRASARFRYVNGFAAELTRSEAEALARSPFVRWVEPDHRRELLSTAPVDSVRLEASSQQTPFGIAMIGAPGVWSATRGESVRVGVIDTGVDRGHPDLAERYRGGWDFVNRDDDPQDDNGHGTHVAGTIAAIDNDFGVVGVAPEAEIYALKALDGNGSGRISALIEAVEWAIDNDLDVINLSLGSTESSLLEREVFDRAEQAGVISIAATGNSYDGSDRIDYPANYSSVVAVGAIDSAEVIAGFSQRGANLDFVAPGVGVESTVFSTFYGITTSDGLVLRAEEMQFSPGGEISGELVECGIGRVGDCPASVVDRIALIERGELTFADKSSNAKAAGAKAVVIYNHHADDAPEGGVIFGTLGAEGDWLLTLGTSNSSGKHLLALSDRNVSLGEITSSSYAKLNGTSMATPHVAGAVTILRALAPTASKFEVIEALRLTAKDLGDPGRDNTHGSGRVDVEAAARLLVPGAFKTEETRRRSVRRPRSGD